MLKSADGNSWIQIWSESTNYRSIAYKSPFFEDQALLQPTNKIFGGAYNGQGYDNGGKWLWVAIQGVIVW